MNDKKNWAEGVASTSASTESSTPNLNLEDTRKLMREIEDRKFELLYEQCRGVRVVLDSIGIAGANEVVMVMGSKLFDSFYKYCRDKKGLG